MAVLSNKDSKEDLILAMSSLGRWFTCLEGPAGHLHFLTVSLTGTKHSICSGKWQYISHLLAFDYDPTSLSAFNMNMAFVLDIYVSCVCFIQGSQKQHILLVQCVTNGLQRNNIWMFTERDTLEKTCIHVLSVRNVFHLGWHYVNIWIFIEVNTSARNVADVIKVIVT